MSATFQRSNYNLVQSVQNIRVTPELEESMHMQGYKKTWIEHIELLEIVHKYGGLSQSGNVSITNANKNVNVFFFLLSCSFAKQQASFRPNLNLFNTLRLLIWICHHFLTPEPRNDLITLTYYFWYTILTFDIDIDPCRSIDNRVCTRAEWKVPIDFACVPLRWSVEVMLVLCTISMITSRYHWIIEWSVYVNALPYFNCLMTLRYKSKAMEPTLSFDVYRMANPNAEVMCWSHKLISHWYRVVSCRSVLRKILLDQVQI